VSVTVAPCHLRPSDKTRLAAVSAAQRAAAEQRAFEQHVTLLQVCYVEYSTHSHTQTPTHPCSWLSLFGIWHTLFYTHRPIRACGSHSVQVPYMPRMVCKRCLSRDSKGISVCICPYWVIHPPCMAAHFLFGQDVGPVAFFSLQIVDSDLLASYILKFSTNHMYTGTQSPVGCLASFL